MEIRSNAQGLLFAAIWTDEVKLEGAGATTLKGWFGGQQIGQTRAVITDAVVSHRGVVTHTVGDAMLCSFADPKAALDAAANIQSRLAKAVNPASGMIVKAKIGLAYGPVRVIAGRVSGEAVNAASMLMENCPPGDILVDQTLVSAVGTVKEPALEAHGSIEGISAFRVRATAFAPEITAKMAAIAPTAPPAPPTPRVEAAPPPPPPPPPAASPAPVTAAAASAVLIVNFGGVEQRFRPSDGEVNIGRGNDNQVIVPLGYVSRKHAKIVWRNATAPDLINLSQNGTCVRLRDTGKEFACSSEMRLEGSGDIVLCGTFSMVTSPSEIVTYRIKIR
jgi:hypothetical protein